MFPFDSDASYTCETLGDYAQSASKYGLDMLYGNTGSNDWMRADQLMDCNGIKESKTFYLEDECRSLALDSQVGRP